MKKLALAFVFLLSSNVIWASFVYIPMDNDSQNNHLKAYGIVYFSLQSGLKAKWLLNYDGGAFLIENTTLIENECKIRGVSYQIISDTKAELILQDIS